MPLHVISEYQKGSWKEGIRSKQEALRIVYTEAVRIASELEDKQEYDIVLTLSNDDALCRWTATLEVKFPRKAYHKK